MADIGLTTTFGIESATPGTYDTVAAVTAITPPGYSREAVDVTHLTSADGYKEFIAGLKEAGEWKLSLLWTPSATDAMVAAFEAETGNYRLTAPNGVKLDAAGFFTAYEFGEITAGGELTASATIKVTGKATLTAA